MKGMSHIFDNITKDILHSLPSFAEFQNTVRTLTDLLSVEHFRARLLGKHWLALLAFHLLIDWRQNNTSYPALSTHELSSRVMLSLALPRLVATCFKNTVFEQHMKHWDGGHFILWRFLTARPGNPHMPQGFVGQVQGAQ